MDFDDKWNELNDGSYTEVAENTKSSAELSDYSDMNDILTNFTNEELNMSSQELAENLKVFSDGSSLDLSEWENDKLPPVPMLGSIPADVPFPGEYGFSIEFEKQPEKVPKSSNWTYSEKLQKIYCGPHNLWPIRIKIKSQLPENTFVRAMLVYTATDKLGVNVARCPNHKLPSDNSNIGNNLVEHVLRCEDRNAVYQIADDSRRCTVAVPYKEPQVGMDFSVQYFYMACQHSCLGGIDKKALKIIFTLENRAKILGRSSFNIRCCASPGRDRSNEEKNIAPKTTKRLLKRQISSGSTPSTSKGIKTEKMYYYLVATNEPILPDNRGDCVEISTLASFDTLRSVAEGLNLRDLQ